MGRGELKIDPRLLDEAREAGLPVERMTEQTLRRALAEYAPYRGLSDEEKARRWAEDNAEAIKAQRERIEAYGVFGEDLRTW
ncbi:type II toxin-antitoxin system CcdA family antitoxin [Phenylobacterium sp.]|uniref:type II toxin-antitoxin system CcdA family antitoxin n=1 Tax=Phenylobacterium sp. TaxID=1871053 RepID=UPI0025CC13B8|nr:type II toxin-antitoxin system CcdA family antitoxin [Phenylobacterium sp.]MBX3486195.1 type II toxin-antitoxin system CcdA family antitoxin [Phenylobacterium sp.]